MSNQVYRTRPILEKGSTVNNRPKTQNKTDSPLRPAPSIRSYKQENFPPLRNLRGTNPWKIRQKKNSYCQTPQRKILRPSPNNSAFSPHRAKAQFHMPRIGKTSPPTEVVRGKKDLGAGASLAEVLADHLDSHIASLPLVTIELHSSQTLQIRQMLTQLIRWKPLLPETSPSAFDISLALRGSSQILTI